MMTKPTAETLAIAAFEWMARDDERIGSFLGMTGADTSDIAAQIQNPDFLGFVLDFILTDDAMVIECAETISTAPASIFEARQYLPGGDAPHWT